MRAASTQSAVAVFALGNALLARMLLRKVVLAWSLGVAVLAILAALGAVVRQCRPLQG
jgi:hypothetical protein